MSGHLKPYNNMKASLLTQHGKESVMRPELLSINPLVASSNLARPTSNTKAPREILGLFLLVDWNVMVTDWAQSEVY
jgi:hypothetical protein